MMPRGLSRGGVAVAPQTQWAYGAAVRFRFILSLLAALALLLGPIAMPGSSAMAMDPGTVASDMNSHCAEEPPVPAQQQAPENCCALGCAAIAAIGGAGVDPVALPSLPLQPPLADVGYGIDPDIQTPPPRSS